MGRMKDLGVSLRGRVYFLATQPNCCFLKERHVQAEGRAESFWTAEGIFNLEGFGREEKEPGDEALVGERNLGEVKFLGPQQKLKQNFMIHLHSKK